MGGLGFIIPKNAKHKQEVWKWIKFCNSKEIQEKWVKNTGQPSRLSTLKKYTNLQPYFNALMESIPIARRMTPLPEFAAIYTSIGTELAAALVGEKPIEDALKAADKAVDEIIVKGGHRG
jgi:ABC-type glycerol-3-phosphate transport system substrate-binding protein